MFGFSSPFRAVPKTSDRRPRNPRFAPEFLEGRLAPAPLVGLAPTVLVASTTTVDTSTGPDTDGEPPVQPTPVPRGPVLPA